MNVSARGRRQPNRGRDLCGGRDAGKTGLPAHAGKGCEKARADNSNDAVIPDGWAPDKLRQFERVARPVREAHRSGKTVARVCHPRLVGTSAGIVRGHEAVSSERIRDDWVNGRAEW